MAEYNLLQKKILADGTIKSGDVLKVDSFLNHQIDVPFISKLGKEFYELFKDRPISKILTIEASGIGIACLTAVHFRVPVLFAKKSAGSNMDQEVYSTEIKSFTHNKVNHVIVSKKYLNAGDHVLIIDSQRLCSSRAHRSGPSGRSRSGRRGHCHRKRLPGRWRCPAETRI